VPIVGRHALAETPALRLGPIGGSAPWEPFFWARCRRTVPAFSHGRSAAGSTSINCCRAIRSTIPLTGAFGFGTAAQAETMIQPLGPPDSLHLQAAQGWLELSNHHGADAELDKITARLRAHPAVPEVQWEICATVKNWDAALEIASAVVQMVPDHPLGWVHRSFCLHELERTSEGHDNPLGLVRPRR